MENQLPFSKICHDTREMVKEYMATFDPSHDIHHVDRVVHLATTIADDMVENEKKGVDLEVVTLAALCHDIGDHKYVNTSENGQQQQRVVTAFLEGLGYAKAELVGKIVNHIGFSKELGWNDDLDDAETVNWRNHCPELHAVQDADKLDAIGAFGILRCAAFSIARNRPLHIPSKNGSKLNSGIKKALTQEAYLAGQKSTEASAIDHFHEKLFKLKSMMRTSKGRALAVDRHDFMLKFVQQIEKESFTQ